MEIQYWPATHAEHTVLPYVQDALCKLHQQFTCGPTWRKDFYHGNTVETVELSGTPLSKDARLSAWRRPILIDVTTSVTLGEYTWHIFGAHGEPERGKPRGLVQLEASMSVGLDVLDAYPGYLRGINHDGFLCTADTFGLPDGSECYRLATSAGLLWLRERSKSHGFAAILSKQTPTYFLKKQVLGLLESACSVVVKQEVLGGPRGPWDGYETRDHTGRKWLIKESILHFNASITMADELNRRLENQQHLLLKPPYEVVWQPNPQQDYGVVFRLSTE